jgi:hypothetical protein
VIIVENNPLSLGWKYDSLIYNFCLGVTKYDRDVSVFVTFDGMAAL